MLRFQCRRPGHLKKRWALIRSRRIGRKVNAPDAATWRLDYRLFLARRTLRLLPVFLPLATRPGPPKTARHAGLSHARERIRQATMGPRLGMNCEHNRKTSGVQAVCGSCLP
jgi:hypothetical protein